MKAYRAAGIRKDVPAMETYLARIKAVDPKFDAVGRFELELMILKNQWTDAEKALPIQAGTRSTVTRK